MQFKCSTIDLASASNIVCKALPARVVAPFSSAILIKAENNIVTLIANSHDITIKKEIKALVQNKGQVLIEGKTFSEFIKKVSCEEIELEENESTVDENEERRLIIKYDDSNILNLSCLPDKYPKIEEKVEYYDIETSQMELKEILEKGSYCISAEDARPALKGCFLETKDDFLTIVSLDGYRMAVVKCKLLEKNNNISALVQGKSLIEIAKVLESNEEIVKIKKTKNMIYFNVATTTIILRIMQLEFYNYENILPKDHAIEVFLIKEDLQKSVDRVSLMCKSEKDYLKMYIEENEIKITVVSSTASIEERVKCKKIGEDILMAFNYKFLRDALSKCKDKEIKAEIISPIKPLLFVPIEGDHFKHLILPVKLEY
ncbi:MAG: DNA polymerase III subunit beta [Christensenellaceae bacterium]|jgi:DNA polymerase-3 subunit beta|nr:DNA polymerase III subunit beta [Christensenellaceae bacterium]